ncbi:hypothetical protein C8F01DRAFT_1000994 [Mycena amicta]|nr:hypothetical protein C8F01DRAFT_1000994 [Mycena amicta]
MENTIGNLGGEIHQHVNLYANLSQRAARQAQVNALKSIAPELVPDENKLPPRAVDLHNDYVLLVKRDDHPQQILDTTGDVLKEFVEMKVDQGFPEDWAPSVSRYARLWIPNGQIAKSAWKEKCQSLQNVRMAHNYVDNDLGRNQYGEVQFYFVFEQNGYALVLNYSLPDMELLKESSQMLWVCEHKGDLTLSVVDVKDIRSVVAMVPFDEERVFVVYKMGLEAG